MSTTKEQRREKEEHTMILTPTITFATSPSQLQQREQSVNRDLDQTIDIIKRTTDEASKDIPSYTQMIDQYQEQTIQQRRF